jgi:hypothetical protein
MVDLLCGALGRALGHVDNGFAWEALCRIRLALVETDDAGGWRNGGELRNGGLARRSANEYTIAVPCWTGVEKH